MVLSRKVTYDGHLLLHLAQSPQQDEPFFLRRTARIMAPAITAAITATRMISTGLHVSAAKVIIKDLPCIKER